jgi:hypothetical protein
MCKPICASNLIRLDDLASPIKISCTTLTTSAGVDSTHKGERRVEGGYQLRLVIMPNHRDPTARGI